MGREPYDRLHALSAFILSGRPFLLSFLSVFRHSTRHGHELGEGFEGREIP